MSRLNRRFVAVIVMMGSLSGLPGSPQGLNELGALPAPTGPFHLGKVVLHLIDKSRMEPLSPNHDFHELMVDIWYPADPSPAEPAAYLDVNAFLNALGNDEFNQEFGDAQDPIKRGVRTHAVLNAPFAGTASGAVKSAPLIVFSPGAGLFPQIYTAQMENLASHGYIVAAICHPYNARLTIFPGGRSIAFDSKRWPEIPSVEGTLNLNQLEWHAADIRFVLDSLSSPEPGLPPLPFANHIDFTRLGAFGHSFGGMAASHACQLDSRLSGCLDQDGLVAQHPFYLDERGWGLDQPYMLIHRASPMALPSDKELAAIKVTREQAENVLTRQLAYQDKVFRSTGKGSYDVIIRRQGTTHMDFTDLPVLSARNPAERQSRQLVLTTVEQYTLSFFDRYVGRTEPTLLERLASPPNDFIEAVRIFPPAQSPYRHR